MTACPLLIAIRVDASSILTQGDTRTAKCYPCHVAGSSLTAVQEKWVNSKPACQGKPRLYENAPAVAGSVSPNLHAERAARNPSLLGRLGVRSRHQGCRFLPQQGNVPGDDRPDQGVVDGRVLMSELVAKIDDPTRI